MKLFIRLVHIFQVGTDHQLHLAAHKTGCQLTMQWRQIIDVLGKVLLFGGVVARALPASPEGR